MVRYVTNKGIEIFKENEDKYILEDVLGNKIEKNDENEIKNIASDFNLKICAKKYTHSNGFINPVEPFSIIINDLKEYYLQTKIGLFLELLRQIEDTSFQLIIRKQFEEEVLTIYKYYNHIKVAIREGHVDCNKWEEIINDIKSQNKDLANAILAKDEIARLGDLIRTEICHAEFCLINSISSVKSHIKVENSRKKLNSGEERICYGFYVDSATWNFIDAIKSISTALDSLAKLTKYIFDLDVEKMPKKKNVLFGDLKHVKNWSKLLTTHTLEQLNNQFDGLQSVINFRHHVTHNSGLFHSQNSILIGRRTPCINNLDLVYGDLLMWDRNGKEFSSSQRTVGFFSQQNNAIEFANDAIEQTVKYVENIFRLLRSNILEKCKTAKIEKLSLIRYNLNQTITFSKHTTSDLQKTVLV